MSLKICIRLLPATVKHLSSQKSKILLRGYVGFTNLQSPRFMSTQKETEKPSRIERELVYSGMLTSQIRGVKFFSVTTSVIGIAAQPVIYKELSSMDSLPLVVAVGSCIGFFTFVTPFVLHFITKKYIMRLYYKPETETYVAAVPNFFGFTKEIEFSPADVKVPDILGMFTSFEVKGIPLFLESTHFENPAHYGRIMGYDKPLDLKLYGSEPNSKR